eukprot:2801712-Rhodomonas_salina.1
MVPENARDEQAVPGPFDGRHVFRRRGNRLRVEAQLAVADHVPPGQGQAACRRREPRLVRRGPSVRLELEDVPTPLPAIPCHDARLHGPASVHEDGRGVRAGEHRERALRAG